MRAALFLRMLATTSLCTATHMMYSSRSIRRLLLAAGLCPLVATPAIAAPAPAAPPEATARVIVKFKPGSETVRQHALSARQMQRPSEAADALQQRAAALGKRHGHALSAGRGLSERMQVLIARGIDSHTLARTLATDRDVEYVAIDHLRKPTALPNDPLFGPVAGTSPASGQWYLKSPQDATGALSSINAPGAWNITTGSSSVVVAVLDTGVRTDHVDLAGQLLAGYDMVTNTAIANDGDARDSDANDPGDYLTSADVQTPQFSGCDVQSSSWHGTQMSGIIGAATQNGIGMAGMSWGGKILPVRVLGKCGGYDSDIIAGMRWAAGLAVAGVPNNPNPAKVLNMSLGGTGGCTSPYSDTVGEIVTAGAVIVAAAGNGAGEAVNSPGNCPGVIAVTGLRHAGTKVGFADLGPEVSIAAPAGNCVNDSGECVYPILSTTNASTTEPVAGAAGSRYTDGANFGVGTSYSTPMVSGTVALMLSANPSLTPSQVASMLKSSARDFVSPNGQSGPPTCSAPNGQAQLECFCTTSTCGAGMLDAGAAVQAAASANAGPLTARIAASPRVPSPNDTVTLSGANTLLGTGRSIASHAWTLVDNGGIVSGFTGATNAATATVQPSAVGSFVAQLTVVDDLGATSTTQITVVVDSLSVQALATPATATAGETVTLSADQLQLSPGRTLTSYGWTLVSGGAGVTALSGTLSGESLTVTPTTNGEFVVRLTVTNDLGKQAAADVTVTVSASATPSPTTNTAAGSGGGAVSVMWQLGLLMGTLCLGGLGRGRARW